MNIDAAQPIRFAGIAPATEPRFMLSTKGQGSEALPHSEAAKTAAGNTVGLHETDKALHELGQATERFNVSLKFTRDEDTGTIVVEMIDQTSGETLSQFPSDAMLQLAATLSKLQGKIFNCRV